MNSILPVMAWRSLTRHLRRSLLTISAIALGLAALIFLWGFNDGLHANMVSNFQGTIIGSLQIHRKGFFTRPKLSLQISNPQEVREALSRLGIQRWTVRLESFALAAGEKASEGLMLVGMSPARERLVTRLPEKVGRGRFLAPGDEYVCVLGETTARNLKVDLGDTLVLVANDRFGAMVAEEFTLVGILTGGQVGLDRGMAVVPLGAVQEMLEMQGQVTDFPVYVEARDLDRVTRELRRSLEDRGYEVMPWNQMFPVMQEWVTLHNGFMYLFMGIVALIVLGGVLNTVMLSMVERTREFGVLMGLGTRPAEVAALVAFESLMLGVAGTGTGIALGFISVRIAGHLGIDLSALLGSTSRFYVDPLVYPTLDLVHARVTVIAVLLTSVLAGLYPAWRAARLEPVRAMKYV